MKSNAIQPKMDIKELDATLKRYLPPETLPQVQAAISELIHSNLWKLRDELTGMYNTQGILQALKDIKAHCLETKAHILILCIDIDKLEKIKQVYGNSEGDSVIQTLGHILEDCVPEEEVCGHLGRGEFVIVMPAADTDERQADALLQAVNDRIDSYNNLSDKEYSLHVIHSIFFATPGSDTKAQILLDTALSQKRLRHKNSRNFDTKNHNIDPHEHRLVNEIINQNRFRYAFQPIVDARTGDIYAYEALMRTEEGISLSPLAILKYASLDNRLYDVERATFFNVLRHLAELPDIENQKFFINSISSCQLVEADYNKLRLSYGDLFSNTIIEITEQTELDDAGLDELLKRSKNDGFGLAIDDYGTGYSNTSILLRYLPNCVKIDRMLITGIQENPKKQHFVNNIITFAHDNGFLALAEGVETSAELKTVIRMGIDLIQGFYTAKPDFTLLKELPAEIKNEIINDNIGMHENIQRKVYIVNGEQELLLMQLALEQYTGIVVAQPELTLVGNQNYPAGMSVKIKDGCHCRLTLRDVYMESIEDMPCIDLGNDVHLTLVLEGSNVLMKTGIRVPDGSSCRLEGPGNLAVFAKGIYCYGIGNDLNSGVGSVTCASSGKLEINTDGNHCLGIGGGIYRKGEGIRILSGDIWLKVTGVEAIGIGCREGTVPIGIQECRLNIDFRVATGCAIGSWKGDQRITLRNVELSATSSGSRLSGIGSIEKTAGEICIEHAAVQLLFTGQKVCMIGNMGGGLKIVSAAAGMMLKCEGSSVLGIGSFDRSAVLETRDVTVEINLRAAEPIAIGAEEENCTFENSMRIVKINQD